MLIHDPSVLFLDEPTTGLDVMSARALREIIQSLKNKGLAILLTTHYIEEADRLCDRIAIIVKGKFISSCRKSDGSSVFCARIPRIVCVDIERQNVVANWKL